MFLADALRFNERSCETVDLSFNPLMSKGVSYILQAKEHCSVHHWGLQAVLQSASSIGNNSTTTTTNNNNNNNNNKIISKRDMSGYYVLQLDHPYDHGLAELLRIRAERNNLSEWRSIKYTDAETLKKINKNGNKNKIKKKQSTTATTVEENDDSFKFNGGTCEIPYEGALEFYFVDEKTVANLSSTNTSPVVHFRLDMSKIDDRGIMRTMLRRARSEPGDNIINVFINDRPISFNGHSTEDQRKLQSLTNGIVTFAYSTTLMRHEQHWKLNLKIPCDNAIVHKLLEKIYNSAVKISERKGDDGDDDIDFKTLSTAELIENATQDTWTNTMLDNKRFELHSWYVHFGETSQSILDHIDGSHTDDFKRKKHTTAANIWRVPTKGMLEFDSVSSHPQVVVLTSHTFNLSVPNDLVSLLDLWTRACSHQGQTIWNSTIKTGGKEGSRPIQLPETLLLHSEGEAELMRILPNKGILSLDFITLIHHDKSKWMKRYSFAFSFFSKDYYNSSGDNDGASDCGNDGDSDGGGERKTKENIIYSRHRQGIQHRKKACAIFERTKKSPGSMEFCLNIEIDGIHVPQNQLNDSFEIPPLGSTFTFEVATYTENQPISHSTFLSVCENIAQQSSSAQRKEFIECLANNSNNNDDDDHSFYINCEQCEVLLKTIHSPKERWSILQILCNCIVDPVNLILSVYDLLMVKKNKNILLKWIRRDIPTLSLSKHDIIKHFKRDAEIGAYRK